MDNGVDLTFTYPSSYRKKGFKRIVDSGQCLDFQLKATTENSIVRVEDGFQYDVKVNNYNDLIYRRDNSLIPLFLVIFILPYENYDWVNIDFDSLIMKKNAFWYYPDQNEKNSDNKSKTRIFVQDINRIDEGFFDEMIRKFYF